MILTGLMIVILWLVKPENQVKQKNQKPNIKQTNQKSDLKKDKPGKPENKKPETQKINVKDSKAVIKQVENIKRKELSQPKEKDSTDKKTDTSQNLNPKDNK